MAVQTETGVSEIYDLTNEIDLSAIQARHVKAIQKHDISVPRDFLLIDHLLDKLSPRLWVIPRWELQRAYV
jgi:hypothetical protein